MMVRGEEVVSYERGTPVLTCGSEGMGNSDHETVRGNSHMGNSDHRGGLVLMSEVPQ